MAALYHVAMLTYGLAVYLVSPFNSKAARWLAGRKGLWARIRKAMQDKSGRRAWFHCASLGEFELAKPLIKAFRESYPGYQVVLTFFSPSGYEHAKHDGYADHVFYLPLDGPVHAKRFISAVAPSIAFFVKTDIWYFYIRELARKKIPSFTVSSRFHKGQYYFNLPGRPFQKILKRVSHHFVVDQASLAVMYDAGLANVTVCGDLRFDRVARLPETALADEIAEEFCRDHLVVVAGSTWDADEKLLAGFLDDMPENWRLVVAPHEVGPDRIRAVERNFNGHSVRYGDDNHTGNARVLVIDRIGKLSALYRYGKYAYVGGAFGKGLHNILEPVAFGLPVFFGPRIRKFPEAAELAAAHLSYVVNKPGDMKSVVQDIESGRVSHGEIRTGLLKFVSERQGATRVILNHLEVNNVVSPKGI